MLKLSQTSEMSKFPIIIKTTQNSQKTPETPKNLKKSETPQKFNSSQISNPIQQIQNFIVGQLHFTVFDCSVHYLFDLAAKRYRQL
jgi:hypothetical protein